MKKSSITVTDDRAKLNMSISELRVLRKILGNQSIGRMKDEGLTNAEIRVFQEIYQALADFFTATA